jgi:hypothetical protein
VANTKRAMAQVGRAGLRAPAGYAMGPRGQELDALYHATLAAYLPSIYEHGLQPSGGRGAGLGKGGYEGWSRGKVFLSGPEDAYEWFSLVETHAESEFDDPRAEGAVPVVLRIRNLRRLVQEDRVAAAEHKLDSYYVRRPIPARQLEYFDGRKWKAIDLYDEDEVLEFSERHTECVREEDERGEDEYGEDEERECDYTTLKEVERDTPLGRLSMSSTLPPELYPSAGLSRGSARRARKLQTPSRRIR